MGCSRESHSWYALVEKSCPYLTCLIDQYLALHNPDFPQQLVRCAPILFVMPFTDNTSLSGAFHCGHGELLWIVCYSLGLHSKLSALVPSHRAEAVRLVAQKLRVDFYHLTEQLSLFSQIIESAETGAARFALLALKRRYKGAEGDHTLPIADCFLWQTRRRHVGQNPCQIFSSQPIERWESQIS